MDDTTPRPGGGPPQWAASLNLRSHPEGGWFAETYRSDVEIPASQLPGHSGPRPSATCIVFLLNPGEESAWHRVRSDELWLHHRGGRLRLDLGGDGDEPAQAQAITLGSDPAAGERFQALVPAGHWQRARPLDAESVLVGCVVTPGFDFADFTLA